MIKMKLLLWNIERAARQMQQWRKIAVFTLLAALLFNGTVFAAALNSTSTEPQDQISDTPITSQETSLRETEEGAQESSDSASEDENTAEEKQILSFSDVSDPSFYYYKPVYWAVRQNLTDGISDILFGPEESCTRAQIVTFLWRAAGEPEPAFFDLSFEDVETDAYYYKAVLWAIEQGITQGSRENAFEPDKVCTRAQCVTFLWRFNGASDEGIRSDFDDVSADSYYGASVFWALKNGITNGTDPRSFSPDNQCTRAQAVTFFYRSVIKKTENSELEEQEQQTGIFLPAETNGTSGSIILKAAGFSAASDPTEVTTAVWTKEDQSDIRWFSMKPTAEEIRATFETVFNVETFRHFFGTYHAALYLLTAADEDIRQIHLEDLTFEITPLNYMYAEDLGKGKLRVTITGTAPEITSLYFIARNKAEGSKNHTVNATLREDGSWSAVIDWLSFMKEGSCSLEAYAPDSETPLNAITVYIARIKQVIDISQYQGNINWQKLKDSGQVDAVIIRCGLRTSRGKCMTDTKFRTNANSCSSMGIPMGAYWFTSALTAAEAREEADYCASLIQSYDFSLPVFIDTEWGGRSGLNKLSKNARTVCVQAFLERIRSYGYKTGIYAAESWFTYNLNLSAFPDESLWVASWSDKPHDLSKYSGWQYTPKARIPGITANTVDVSYWFD